MESLLRSLKYYTFIFIKADFFISASKTTPSTGNCSARQLFEKYRSLIRFYLLK